MYPFILLADPPRPTYPEYEAVEAEARRRTPSFVDPANLYPERAVVDRRGADWCTAVLGRPYDRQLRISIHEQYLLVAADALGVDPPLPDWIVVGRREASEYAAAKQRREEDARQRDLDAWATALAGATVAFDVHEGSRPRVRGSLYGYVGHAVPRVKVHSGTRKIRIHPAGRALCETPGRARPLDMSTTPAPDGTPATCVNCLTWVPKVRPSNP